MRILREFLFWFHALFIVLAIATGFIFSLPIVIVLVVLHRLHMYVLNDCALSKIHKKVGGLEYNENFLQLASRRLFGVSLNNEQSKKVDYFLASLPIWIALMKIVPG